MKYKHKFFMYCFYTGVIFLSSCCPTTSNNSVERMLDSGNIGNELLFGGDRISNFEKMQRGISTEFNQLMKLQILEMQVLVGQDSYLSESEINQLEQRLLIMREYVLEYRNLMYGP